ncbi:MAG: hypothetical protein GY757_37665, partial [bacterium]|nr:hypothetical protein [bacterium]
RNEIEEKLSEIWTDLLGIPKGNIGIDDDFFKIGGHSLKATIMAARMHKYFNIKLPLTEIFKNTTIRTLGDTIRGKTVATLPGEKETFANIKPVEKKEYYILSSAQKRLFILQQMELESTAYNMPYVLPLRETPRLENPEETFRKLIRRHESLRTSFHMINNNPVQVVHNNVAFKLEKFQVEKNKKDGTEENISIRTQGKFFRSFDLAGAPLLRVGIVETTGTDADTEQPVRDRFMLIDMHHIITDGISQELLIKEFNHLNKGENLPPLKFQYRDYAEWQNSAKQKQLMKQQEETWLKIFLEELPILTLPTDYPRPVMRSFDGSDIAFELNQEETAIIKETAKQNEATLYMTILSIFSILLSKLSGQEDIIVGTPTAGRRHADLENIIGMFVNTLPMRNYPEGGITFKEYLREVKENSLRAFENQEYQFEDLVDRLSVRRDTGRNPIFDVMFNLLHQAEFKENDTTTSPVTINSNNSSNAINSSNSLNSLNSFNSPNSPNSFATSKFDLTLNGFDGVEGENSLNFHFEYCTKLFKEATIKRFITYFKGILLAVSNAPGQKIMDIEIITEEEKKRILYEFNDTAAGYPRDKTIHQLFEEQVEKTPDLISIVGREESVGKGKPVGS